MTQDQPSITSRRQPARPLIWRLTLFSVNACKISNLFAILLTLTFSLTAAADTIQCKKLLKPGPPAEFIIPLPSSEIQKNNIISQHSNLIANERIATMRDLLIAISTGQISPSGPLHSQTETAQFIFDFRQDSSLLRTLFQSLKKRNSAQKEFIKFVRDFGILKDLVMTNDTEGARSTAQGILDTYSNLNFEKLVDTYQTSSRDELRFHFQKLIRKTQDIMDKLPLVQDETSPLGLRNSVTVGELHEVRKSLRDILRFMELETSYSDQISFLKKINSRLGKICDQNASQILAGELTQKSPTEFPPKLIQPINHFLQTYRFE